MFNITQRIKYILLLTLFTITTSLAQEICDNGIDDDGDGLVDCFDPECSSYPGCDGFYFGNDSAACQVKPPIYPNFNIVAKFSTDINEATIEQRSGVMVADLDLDGLPEMIGKEQPKGQPGQINIFSGQDGRLLQTINEKGNTHTHTQVAIADVDKNGLGDIFVNEARTVRRYEYLSDHYIATAENNHKVFSALQSLQIADFNGDGTPEVYTANAIFNAITLDQIIAPDSTKNNGAYSYEIGGDDGNKIEDAYTLAYDIFKPGDTNPNGGTFGNEVDGLELIAGGKIYAVDISLGTLTEISSCTLPSKYQNFYRPGDGFVSIGDFTGNGKAEVVVTCHVDGNVGAIYLWSPYTQQFLADYTFTKSKNIGRCNLGDFDNDGEIEIGTAGKNQYVVLEYNASNSTLDEKWKRSSLDDASEMTGSTLFDFDGDGKIEVVYSEEENLFIWRWDEDSQTFIEVSKVTSRAGTRTEYPLVADVNADGQAEIVMAAQDLNGPSAEAIGYITVWGSYDSPWVSCRNLWNQHGYHITNINDDLTVPIQQQDNFNLYFEGSLNVFLGQTPFITDSLDISYATPDLYIPSITADLSNCSQGQDIPITITIGNQGDWPAAVGTPVTLYDGDPYSSTANATVIDTVHLSKTIEIDSTVNVSALIPQNTSGDPINLFILTNHNPYSFDGSVVDVPLPQDSVYTPLLECDYSNNLSLELVVNGCVIPPTIDLDNNNSSGYVKADFYNVYYIGSNSSGNIADEDATITMLGSDVINSLNVTISNYNGVDALDFQGSLPSGVTHSTNTNDQFIFSGDASITEYESILKAIYLISDTTTTKDYTQRQITVVVDPFGGAQSGTYVSNTATAFIDMKARPESNDEVRTINEDTFYTFSASDFDFYDADGDTFDGIRVAYPLNPLNYHGNLVYDGDTLTPYQLTIGHNIPDPSLLRFYPVLNASNDNTTPDPYTVFRFRVKDNTGDDITHHHSVGNQFTINVTPVQDPPISKDTTAIAPLNINTDKLVENLFSFASPDLNATYQSVIIKSLPTHIVNSVFQRDTGGGTFVDIAVDDDIPVGTLIRYNPTTMVGSEPINYDSIYFKVKDNRNLESIDQYTFTVSLLIDIVILDFYKIGLKNTPLSFNNQEFNDHYHNVVPTDLIQNITIKSLPNNGTLKFNNTPVTVNQDISFASINQLIFEPDSFWHGSTNFDYAVEDQNGDMSSQDATIYILIKDVRHDPVARDDFASTISNIPVLIDALSNDYDNDNDSIYLTSINSSTHGEAFINNGQVYFIPEENYVGAAPSNQAVINYTIADGIDGTSSANINVDIFNDTPIVGDIYYGGYVGDTVFFKRRDFESRFNDGQALTKIKFTSLPIKGNIYQEPFTAITLNQEIPVDEIDELFYINTNPQQEITEDFLWNGSDGISYATNDAHIFINLYSKTHPPVAVDDKTTTDELTPVTIDVLANDYDIDGHSLEIISVEMNESYQNDGIITVENNQVLFTPIPNHTGLFYANYYITDNQDGTSSALIRIIVANSLEGPTVEEVTRYGEKNSDLQFTIEDFENSYSDPNSASLDSIRISGLPSNGEFLYNGASIVNGQTIAKTDIPNFSYRPNTDFIGNDYSLWSGYNGTLWSSSSKKINIIIVENLDDQVPTVTDINKSGAENEIIYISIEDFENHFSDPLDSTIHAIKITSLPENGRITLNENPISLNQVIHADSIENITYTPSLDFSGIDEFYWNGFNGKFYSQQDAAVFIEIGPELVIYSSFTPNNDGINDYWHIKDIEFYDNNVVTIYNRWGNEVYSARNYDNNAVKWTGFNDGKGGTNALPAGTYFYKVNLNDGSPVRSGYVVLAK
ncbi:Ig-like domain-containing protein [Flammeovirga kamogawensis]|uniref:Gliding motility-associated C-terminal domain-containing protein n=1 Tax=Flammeovirga kamogawensis TaxID=373891 RepID=A0ABX8GXI5_9BACT|nr:gliding motility-associated C-terminal domain-containing protein [Flammeovirga kamogawensis]MBB6463917.1 gliding motility-associated-like protein [Flammeovirga kamogawensis]QWG08319.1 gliding motility-associated C-terminal domain-containing protein [Flammeovirga kamogawensis]TRX66615.1 T9SS type B sorting domain-containing protein [Flammeovirga kamogawensis]